ncbi:MAG TPA: bifunctional glutamate N-acetyltransferase/amino-acid acetyltransferase ArgJ [Amaricoccus sp.]|uniref:bifunctional glutamate N-acetyltransferase/amino-acid acetyltransferase ArgJ n=1 Tax=Amaricoccus sp. TaxID=1872485 RepID=UPI002CDE34F4|nr:bifunctional glutamate N-acetyltransferase/amino-acid acetyltransferase ArgJ [Amaricoccus sp.]HMQ92094.1 bifunctional glutamate N-acetyltransferase/amino-acid acetyltransferase ArgJ [Amaricoccus sp.]HMR50999.1 bifunctional glutamate N-acetyltransferase/amino-acid acetyltransferase ArgJ [Amaricoccus sp.]HMR59324.1 bifunctional glutamate N-acetyltransferase/amino-acid acetyltransferase ArgJ [Amaricoccus sp.]HMT97822.1 bifunctional glutamate N-acetyltransferase/amino-acid acetyltransferase ArgJ
MGDPDQAAPAAPARKAAKPVSPLAPPAGFPELPVIDGVRFAAAEAGVRYPGRLDVMLAEIAAGSALAGVFTRSSTRSMPVLWCQDVLAGLRAAPAGDSGFAILVNSGNSNAFTGGAGREAVAATVAATADTLGIARDHVFVASTGVIGERLPYDRIVAKLSELRRDLDPRGAARAARAIMTTDTYAKGAAARADLGGVPVSIAGFAKGSGMIAPDMATMLVFLFTDAAVAPDLLQDMVSRIGARTFNCITVDGDTSTSDTLLMAATGRAAMPPLLDGDDSRAAAFETALESVMLDLAQQVVRDGEGASKFVEIRVEGALTDGDARKVALSIANSPLVKTAIAGEDPNWGRIVMAVGKSGASADRDRLSIRFGDILVAENGWVSPGYSEAAGAAYMKRSELTVGVDLGLGAGRAVVWTCDLTHGYIAINADYRS